MIVLAVGLLFLALAIVAIRKIAACPLFRTLAASADCWADCVQAREEQAQL